MKVLQGEEEEDPFFFFFSILRLASCSVVASLSVILGSLLSALGVRLWHLESFSRLLQRIWCLSWLGLVNGGRLCVFLQRPCHRSRPFSWRSNLWSLIRPHSPFRLSLPFPFKWPHKGANMSNFLHWFKQIIDISGITLRRFVQNFLHPRLWFCFLKPIEWLLSCFQLLLLVQ